MSKQIKTVIADDHPLFRSGVKDALSKIDTIEVVAEAGDGMQAYQEILSNVPALAVLDIEMPLLSGIDVARKIINEKSQVKVILLTMHKSKHFLHDALQAGVHGYLLKDNAIEELKNCIQTVMGGSIYISLQLQHLLNEQADASSVEIQLVQEKLTATEKVILKLISEGKTSLEIAGLLFISANTVDNHRYNMTKKLSLEGKNSLMKFAMGIKEQL
jgi:two-component system, NarL family, response regulator DegU